MPRFLPDTSCMLAAVCAWHEHHEPARAEIERRLRMGETMIVAAPALVEAYAVLTRLPSPHRLSAGDAFALLEANYRSSVKLFALDSRSYYDVLEWAQLVGIAGGQTYDAVIGECALRARAESLLTFNEGDFKSFTERGIKVVVPGKGKS